MVESSGGSCRCTCQEDFHQDEQEQPSGCCSPHVFTSILLGILSCVLMTGGVFLAFHRWDPMWLMVSGVGVVLILIGTILHCCNNMSQRPKRHSSSKGCCRPVPPDHHVIPNNNGSLTEQLLPLSNARSVSQLSLNMLPGYFPPVVTAYGIEQHSAVVQNINRLVQQQQQQPQSPAGSCSPGVSSTAGKSFIVLSLPGDTSTANIQNLVATVYQLDGNTTESSANEIHPNGQTTPVTIVKPNPPVPLVLKNAEVQTCSVWPAAVATTSSASTSGENSAAPRSSSTDDTAEQSPGQASATTGATQTDDILAMASEPINLMDCSSDITPICDTPVNACDSQSTDNTNNALVDIPSSQDLLDVSPPSTVTEYTSSVLVDIPEPPVENLNATDATSSLLMDVVVNSSPNIHSGVLVDISADANADGSNGNTLLDGIINSNVDPTQEGASATTHASTSDTLIDLPQRVPENTNSNLQSVNPELLSSVGNLSAADTEIDDGELMDRSSPPPSYEDVTLEGENIGAFGLAYGTI